MEILKKEVPKELLKALPEGMKYVSRKGHEYLVVEKVLCPNGHNMLSEDIRIHGEKAIQIKVKFGIKEGSLFLDPFWGSHSKLYSFIPGKSKTTLYAEAFCPCCDESLMVDDNCSDENCDSSKSIVLALPGKKNKIYICQKLGCPGHYIDIKEQPDNISAYISSINYTESSFDENIEFLLGV